MNSAGDIADPFIGLTIGSATQPEVKLRIERRLGEGGTAAAYFATRFGPDGISPVVVKVILPSVIARAGVGLDNVDIKSATTAGVMVVVRRPGRRAPRRRAEPFDR